MDAFHSSSGPDSQSAVNAYADGAPVPSVHSHDDDAWGGASGPRAPLVQTKSQPLPAVEGGAQQHIGVAGPINAGRHRQPIERTVTERIVPRLAVTHRGRRLQNSEAWVGTAVIRLAERSLASDVAGAASLMKCLMRNGHALDDLYLDVVAGAARHLGQLWHDDAISFVDVTIGMLALCRLLHEFDDAFCGKQPCHHPSRSMLLVARPGEAHEFAAHLVSAFLRRAGWNVTCVTLGTQDELINLLARNWYTLLGLSESCSVSVDDLGSCIRAARKASRNRRLRVIVGGPAFVVDPGLAIRVGANASASDARHAVTQAEGLLTMARRDG